MELFQKVKEEQEYLEQIRKKAEKDYTMDGKNKMKGNLRIQKKGNSVQYYHTLSQEQQEYIPKKNLELVKKLAQRDYDNKLIKEIEKRQKLLNSFMAEYPSAGLEEVYDNMNEYRKSLLDPIVESDEQYAKIWINTPYIRKIVGEDVPEIYTENGERVRSKSEKMIADKLKAYHVLYRYEAPLGFGRAGTIHPDFTILNKRTRKVFYYEHFGMMDNMEYMLSVLKRMEFYQKHGIFPGDTLLFSWETKQNPLNMKLVEEMIKKYLL